ncbi:hypothetical protein [Microbacterium schleiferi]|uniref:hypothetical protein n=1 Tax=Microbacterium schleiferi TaxID=69362 RepID=UPI0035C87790
MTSPFLYFVDERLSLAELSAARLDGHLIEVDAAYMPADTVETPSARAASLGPLLRDLMAATHLSAAWVHGVISEPPSRHTVQRAVPHRIHGVIHRRLHYRDPYLPASDLYRIGGVLVTSPARTVADLARVSDADHRTALDGFARDPATIRAGIDWLEHAGTVPHKVRALDLLRSRSAEPTRT